MIGPHTCIVIITEILTVLFNNRQTQKIILYLNSTVTVNHDYEINKQTKWIKVYQSQPTENLNLLKKTCIILYLYIYSEVNNGTTDRSEKCKHWFPRAGNYFQLKSIVVQFNPWLKFYFPLFWGMVMLIMNLKQG